MHIIYLFAFDLFICCTIFYYSTFSLHCIHFNYPLPYFLFTDFILSLNLNGYLTLF
jgi:hypothetical protein